MSPDWATCALIRGMLQRLSPGLFDLDLHTEVRPPCWPDLGAQSLHKLSRGKQTAQSRISGLDLVNSRSSSPEKSPPYNRYGRSVLKRTRGPRTVS